jgi:hypothetical protein
MVDAGKGVGRNERGAVVASVDIDAPATAPVLDGRHERNVQNLSRSVRDPVGLPGSATLPVDSRSIEGILGPEVRCGG